MIVVDAADHSVDDVAQKEVEFLEDCRPQTIASMTRDQRPLDYAVVMDNSLSFKDLLVPAIEGAKILIEANSAADETFLERFIASNQIEKTVDFTGDKEKLIKGLDQFYVDKGQTAIIDALFLAIQHTSEHTKDPANRRRAVVLFSDGEDRASYYTDKQLFKLIGEKDVQIFVIGVVALIDKEGGLFSKSPQDKALRFLTRLAGESGGRVFLPKNRDELRRASREIAHDLHLQYLVSYQSASSNLGFRRWRVKVVAVNGHEPLRAITRAGYAVNGQYSMKGSVKECP